MTYNVPEHLKLSETSRKVLRDFRNAIDEGSDLLEHVLESEPKISNLYNDKSLLDHLSKVFTNILTVNGEED